MTERKAAILANQIYAAHKAKMITGREAVKALDSLVSYMSVSQYIKHYDFVTFCKENKKLANWDSI